MQRTDYYSIPPSLMGNREKHYKYSRRTGPLQIAMNYQASVNYRDLECPSFANVSHRYGLYLPPPPLLAYIEYQINSNLSLVICHTRLLPSSGILRPNLIELNYSYNLTISLLNAISRVIEIPIAFTLTCTCNNGPYIKGE